MQHFYIIKMCWFYLKKKSPTTQNGCKNGLITNIFTYIHFTHHNTFSTKFKSEMNLALQVGTLSLLKLQQQLNLFNYFFQYIQLF